LINLIKNELIKIIKKKSLYITMLFILIFVVLTNCMYKFSDNIIDSLGIDSNQYLKEELKNLDPNKSSDVSTYIGIKTEIELNELLNEYGKDSWQAYIINDKMQEVIYEINNYKYGFEKNEEMLKKSEEKYNEIIEKLKNEDWKYFTRNELEEIDKELLQENKMKSQEEDKSKIKEIDEIIFDLELKKQILNWRIDKNISYSNGYLNQALDDYYSTKKSIRAYEKENNQEYEKKLEYYSNKEKLALSEYIIENKQDIQNTYNARGILINLFSEYDILIIVLIVMIAGSIVSEEFNKGTIKLLLVRPYKRSKILLSKYITCIISIILAMVMLAIIQLITGGVIFGFDSLKIPVVIYDFNINSVVIMSLFKYLVIFALAKLPQYILIVTIAFMFSVVYSSTAFSITISLIAYMSAGIINAMAQKYSLKIMRFFITTNWNIEQFLFGRLPIFQHISLGFSISICAIYLICMLVPSFIIFNKKNIKNI